MPTITQTTNLVGTGLRFTRGDAFANYASLTWDGTELLWGGQSLAWGIEPGLFAANVLTTTGLSFTRATALT